MASSVMSTRSNMVDRMEYLHVVKLMTYGSRGTVMIDKQVSASVNYSYLSSPLSSSDRDIGRNIAASMITDKTDNLALWNNVIQMNFRNV